MNPDLDHQDRRNPWPWPVDTPLDRARKVAGMYRQHLKTAAPAVCATLDDTVRGFGEDWLLDREQVIDPDREVTTSEAAEMVRVHPDTVRRWACLEHPDDPTRPLLARYGRRGRERTYIAGKVIEAAAWAAQGKLARARNLRQA